MIETSKEQDEKNTVRFSMDVPIELNKEFEEACGLAPKTAVTKELWLRFIAEKKRI